MRVWLAALVMVPVAAWGQTAPVVEQAWARATTASAQSAAAYLVVHGTSADQITGFSTPVAATASLHQSTQANGVSEMRPVAALPLQPGQDVKLAPGGYHVMLMGLKQPLKLGDHFPLTVKFAHSAPVTVDVSVQRAGASSPDMGGMKMP